VDNRRNGRKGHSDSGGRLTPVAEGGNSEVYKAEREGEYRSRKEEKRGGGWIVRKERRRGN